MRNFINAKTLATIKGSSRARFGGCSVTRNAVAAVRHTFRNMLSSMRPCVSVALLCAAAVPTQARELRWHLQPGNEYRVIVERTVRQKSVLADWLENIRYQMAWTVTAVDDQGQMQIVQKLLEVKHSIQMADAEPVNYDSSHDAEARGDATTLARSWKPLLQIERPFLLLPNGKTERIETPAKDTGTAASSTTAVPAAGANNTAAVTPPTTATTPPTSPTITTTRPVAAKLLQDGLWLLPSDDVQPGTHWEESSVLPWGDDGEALRLTTLYEYAGEQTFEQSVADHIDVKLNFATQPRGEGNERLIIERQSSSGSIDFDATAGYLNRSELSHDLVLQLLPRTPSAGTGTAPPAFTNPTAAPTRAEISTTVKVRFQRVEPVGEPERVGE